MDEIWKPVCGYEGMYEVSSIGRVRSAARTVHFLRNGKPTTKNFKPRIRAQLKNPRGYMRLTLFKGGKTFTHYVHRLVAEAFLETRSEEVNHLDFNKQNNSIENLEWCTSLENMRHYHDKRIGA